MAMGKDGCLEVGPSVGALKTGFPQEFRDISYTPLSRKAQSAFIWFY